MNVIVVDDVPSVAESMADFLRLLGHEVCVAFTGQRALEIARDFRPDAGAA